MRTLQGREHTGVGLMNSYSPPARQEQGFPWIVRKTAVKFGSSGATDLVWQSEDGGTMKIVSVNAKGSWQRKLVVGKVVSQRNAVGAMCNTTCWWDGALFDPHWKIPLPVYLGGSAYEHSPPSAHGLADVKLCRRACRCQYAAWSCHIYSKSHDRSYSPEARCFALKMPPLRRR